MKINEEIAKIEIQHRDLLTYWRENRKFLSQFIDQDGTWFDPAIGSASLPYSLSLWSGFRLEPFGTDISEDALKLARKLYPDFHDRFICLDFHKFNATGFKFDYVYQNIFTDQYFNTPHDVAWLNKLIKMTEKKLILSSYGEGVTRDIFENKLKDVDQYMPSRFIKSNILSGSDNCFGISYYQLTRS